MSKKLTDSEGHALRSSIVHITILLATCIAMQSVCKVNLAGALQNCMTGIV